MEVKQIYSLVNDVTKEVLGDSVILAEDLSNVVDVGNAIFDNNSFDKYSGTLVDHIGRVIFVNRVYSGFAPNVLKDSWEYGAVLQKISSTLPEAEENESWELTNGTSYDPNIFNGGSAISKFYNKRVTFEIDRSITEEQIKSAFSSASQLNGFVSMLFNEIDKSMTIKTDALIMRGIASMIADTLYDDFGSGTEFSGASHVKAVNLLYLYNTENNTTLTPEKAIKTPEFIRFAVYTMSRYKSRLSSISTLFNVGGQPRFTPTDLLHCVVHADFDASVTAYLQSDTYHNDLVALPNHEVVPYWQGSGKEYAFADTSKIECTSGNNHTVTAGGILAVMFDNDAVGVSNVQNKVTTKYNPKGDFTNYFYKRTEALFTDGNENCVVFFMA